MRQEHKAVKERLDQDRLRNDPTAAADRLISDLMRQSPSGRVFAATSKMIVRWTENGESQGNPYDLNVALMLANRNMKRAKKFQKATVFFYLGYCRRVSGNRKTDLGFLQSAEKAFRAALKATSKTKSPRN